MIRHSRSAAPAWALLIALATSACGPETSTRPGGETAAVGPRVFSGPIMGTRYTVKVVAPELADGVHAELGAAIEAALADVDAKMSTYKPESEISLLNALGGGERFPVSPETFEVLELARRISDESGGALDVTVGPLVDAWGFGAGSGPAGALEPLPSERVEELRDRVGFDKLILDPASSTVEKRLGGLQVDLSAVAKGYAVDRVAEELRERGHEAFMVEVGGEVRTAGFNADGEPWRIGIEDPGGSTPALPATRHDLMRVVPLSDAALATSGDYRNFFEHQGRRYSHTLDPRTGRPVEHTATSVTVVAPTCAEADAWATALLVLGPEEGLALAEEQDLRALFVVRGEGGTLEQRWSPAWAEHLADASAATAP